MAAPNDNLNDPRWEGLDSQSLPDRPAHPDPSKFTEHGDEDKVPSHGIVGHLDAKIGLTSDAQLRADSARYHRDVAAQYDEAQKAAKARADAGDEDKANAQSARDSAAYHKSLAKDADDAPLDPGAAVREDVLSGKIKSAPEVDVTKADVDAEATTKAKHG